MKAGIVAPQALNRGMAPLAANQQRPRISTTGSLTTAAAPASSNRKPTTEPVRRRYRSAAIAAIIQTNTLPMMKAICGPWGIIMSAGGIGARGSMVMERAGAPAQPESRQTPVVPGAADEKY